MYWLSISVTDGMMGYLQSAAILVVTWKSLSKINEENTKIRKLQLKTQLNTVKRGSLCINDYALKITGIVEALRSISVIVEDDDIVCAMLEGLEDAYSNFKSSMNTRDDVPGFTELTSMLIREEKNLGLVPYSSLNKKVLISKPSILIEAEAGRCTSGGRGQNQDVRHNQDYGCGRGQQNS